VTAAASTIRQEWEDGYRRLQREARDPTAQDRLLAQVEVVTDELRRRVGGRFTTAKLVDAYRHADGWTHDAVAERASSPGWPRTLSIVVAAAFHLYSRGALDYEP